MFAAPSTGFTCVVVFFAKAEQLAPPPKLRKISALRKTLYVPHTSGHWMDLRIAAPALAMVHRRTHTCMHVSPTESVAQHMHAPGDLSPPYFAGTLASSTREGPSAEKRYAVTNFSTSATWAFCLARFSQAKLPSWPMKPAGTVLPGTVTFVT